MPVAIVVPCLASCLAAEAAAQEPPRPRARDLGLQIGALPPGPQNAITDVPGVRVGQVTVTAGENIRTGVTAVLPHGGNLFREKVPAAIHTANGFGKLVGATQVQELGQLETPILLTNTLAVWTAADALAEYILGLPGNEGVRSVNPVVGETNDGTLNDIRNRPITRAHALQAIQQAKPGPVAEGSIGAGTGTISFGWKGGIGTSSRLLPKAQGGYTVGVLVQTNYGGQLEIAGVPIGRLLTRSPASTPDAGGSCMIVVATDAPLDAHALTRIARRAPLALGRTGSVLSHGSGDYVIAFSAAPGMRITTPAERSPPTRPLRDDALTPLFQATVEATEEAIYNSLFKATTIKGHRGHTAEALPVSRVRDLLRQHGRVR
jgi:D-aminopeptidase